MNDKKICYWCEQCSKKVFLDHTNNFIEVQKSLIQKKVPFIDHENKNKKTKPVYVERKSVFKCVNCGYLLKRIQDEKK